MNNKGFTLIELLIVIAIIGILAAAVLVAVDPVARIQDARNARRWSEVNGLLNAVLNKQVDDRALYTANNGSSPVTVANTVQLITGTGTTTRTTCAGAQAANGSNVVASSPNNYIDMTNVTPTYIATLPFDPVTGNATGFTGYYFHMSTAGRITIGACDPEKGMGTTPVIAVTR